MKEPRRLSLTREALADLTPGDLAAVQGGANYLTQSPCATEESRMICSLRCALTFNTCDGCVA